MSNLRDAAAAVRTWLTRDGLPLWGVVGVDETGSFHESIGFDGRPDIVARRMRVQARQLHVFSEAAVRGWWPQARAVADGGFRALVRDFWQADGQAGFIHSVTPDRKPLDLKRDTYDHAFGLFALAWYYKASRDPDALRIAHEILDFLERDMADGNAGGFVESRPEALPRRSDPHMHLLEASLEWVEAGGGDRFLGVARRMVGLFQSHFFDRTHGVLGEQFAADLGLAEGAAGQMVAPGHHCEWFWLLAWAQARGAGDASAEGRALYDFAISHGLDAEGFAIDECDPSGRQVRLSRRAWPQTELIKAYIQAAREGDEAAGEAAAGVARRFLDTYLATDVPGLWMDQFDAEGQGMTKTAPASTLYHVIVAFRELMIFAERG